MHIYAKFCFRCSNIRQTGKVKKHLGLQLEKFSQILPDQKFIFIGIGEMVFRNHPLYDMGYIL